MNRLKYRRQFLFTSKECMELNAWQIQKVNKHFLYVHPDCALTSVGKTASKQLLLVGHILHPHFPHKTNKDLLNDLLKLESRQDLIRALYPMVGRFVLIVVESGKYTFFNDACGLKTCVYTQKEGSLQAASQALLLDLVVPLPQTKRKEQYLNSQYVETNIEHWLPSGTTLYEGIHHLKPNHYLDGKTLEQVRYWPLYQRTRQKLEHSVEQMAEILRNTMLAAHQRFKLALPLTAGWDSRIILSSCKDIVQNIWCYTLQYRDLTETSNDLKIPQKLSANLDLNYQVIDCRKDLDQDFVKIYECNTDMPHINDWAKIAYGMYDSFPDDRVCIKGNCAEVGRCFYYPSGTHDIIRSSKDLLKLERYWNEIDFIKEHINTWYKEAKEIEQNFDYDVYDLFYWEHRMGSWQAQGQLEWDIVQEVFTPFNNRELLDLMLGIDAKHRCAPNYVQFTKVMQSLWEEVLQEPINPIPVRVKLKGVVRNALSKIGLLQPLKKVLGR